MAISIVLALKGGSWIKIQLDTQLIDMACGNPNSIDLQATLTLTLAQTQPVQVQHVNNPNRPGSCRVDAFPPRTFCQFNRICSCGLFPSACLGAAISMTDIPVFFVLPAA